MRLLLSFLLVQTLIAQAPAVQASADPVATRLAWVKETRDPVVPAFRWLRPKDHRFEGAWELDSDFSRVVMARELIGSDFAAGEQEAWATQLGWAPGPHWLLLSPEGVPLLSGTDLPDAAKVLDAMRGTGWQPRSERRDRFLRDHPNQGDAWAEELYDVARSASHRAVVEHRLRAPDPTKDTGLEVDDLDKRPTPPVQDQAEWGPVAEALRGVMRVDGWQDQPNHFLMLIALQVGGAKASAILKGPLGRFQQGMADALRAHPSDSRLWEAWGTTDYLVGGSDPGSVLEDLTAPPHSPWPPIAAASYLDYSYSQRKDWIGLEALANRAYVQALSPEVRDFQGARFPFAVAVSWGLARLHALAEQGREAEALAFIQELRAQVGSRWPEWSSQSLAPSLAYYLGKEGAIVQAIQASSKEKAPPDPAKPAPRPPLHLALSGHPAWERDWMGYAARSAFDGWGRDELDWSPLKAPEEQALRARMGWGAEPRWVLARGEEVLASGTTLPTPSFLADRLRAEGAPYLEQLDAFIRVHPDHLEARESRMKALRARMPQERLEATLLEDARTTRQAFHPGTGVKADWTPRKELWAPAAARELRDLEDRIRRWPERASLWEAWMDWAQVSAAPPSPARLMAGLAIWKTRLDAGAGPLPSEVLRIVSKHLREEGRWADLADWCQACWEGGVREWLSHTQPSAAQDKGRNASEIYATVVVIPYRIALEKLDRVAQLRAFDEDLRDINPMLAKRVTASSTPPRPEK